MVKNTGGKNMNINNVSLSVSNGCFPNKDLKKRLCYSLVLWAICTVVCLCFSSYIMAFIEWPYVYAWGTKVFLESSGPIKELVSYMKVSLTIGFVVSSPLVFYSFWQYLFSRLYKKDTVTKFWAIFSATSFLIGALFFLFVFAPLYFSSVVKAGRSISAAVADANIVLETYVSFVTMGILITGFLFHSPMLLVFFKSKKIENNISIKGNNRL
jgi:Sec-independent protein secretion pathway component TatC